MEIIGTIFGLLFIVLVFGSILYGVIIVIRDGSAKKRIVADLPTSIEQMDRKIWEWSQKITPVQLAYAVYKNKYQAAAGELLIPAVLAELFACNLVVFDENNLRIGFKEDANQPEYRQVVLQLLRYCAMKDKEGTTTGVNGLTWVDCRTFLKILFPTHMDVGSSEPVEGFRKLMTRDMQSFEKSDPNFRKDMEFIRRTFEVQYGSGYALMSDVMQRAAGGRVDAKMVIFFMNLFTAEHLKDKPKTMLNRFTAVFLHYSAAQTDTSSD